jgi:hypothetical protein
MTLSTFISSFFNSLDGLLRAIAPENRERAAAKAIKTTAVWFLALRNRLTSVFLEAPTYRKTQIWPTAKSE